MLNDLIASINSAESVSEYVSAVNNLTNYLTKHEKVLEATRLKEIAELRNNKFSNRAKLDDIPKKKKEINDYISSLVSSSGDNSKTNLITNILSNFPRYCAKLYRSKIHEKCSIGIKDHLSGFKIENEYDLQKLMLPALLAVFPDARTESVQDSGHHCVRKDIVIDSESAVIELKCTRTGMAERQLSEEIASDMVHYEAGNLFFYIYDKAGIISNIASFKSTYESKNIPGKNIQIIIYDHDDI